MTIRSSGDHATGSKPKEIADISVIVSNYNNGRYLIDFMESVVESTMWPRELILIDDGSTDDSVEILEKFCYLPFLKLVLFAQNRGFTAALNKALEIAGGKYVMRADPDDKLLPDRIQRQFIFMEKNSDVDISGANVIYFHDCQAKELNRSNFPLTHAQIVKTYKSGEHGLLHATVIAKAGVYQSYRYQKIFPSEDYELFSRMVMDNKRFANLYEPVNLVRIHQSSSTSNLQMASIRQTFAFRDQVFGTKTSDFRIRWYFWHIINYRKYQLSQAPLTRYLFLLLSAVAYPSKISRRIGYWLSA